MKCLAALVLFLAAAQASPGRPSGAARTARIERLVAEHPEYGVPVSDLPAMLGLARIAYASRDSSPEAVRERVFRQCMNEPL